MLVITIHKSDEGTNEEFSSAINCAKESIESVLWELDPTVTVNDRTISIVVSGITANECKEKIDGCFRDSAKDLYPEFLRIEFMSLRPNE